MSGRAAIVLSGGGVQASVRPREGGVVEPWRSRAGRSWPGRRGRTRSCQAPPRRPRRRRGWPVARRLAAVLPQHRAARSRRRHAPGVPRGRVGSAVGRGRAARTRCRCAGGTTWDRRAERTWRLTPDGIEAATRAINDGTVDAAGRGLRSTSSSAATSWRPRSPGAALVIDVPAGAMLAPLDYDGVPAGPRRRMAGSPIRWGTVDARTPARVSAIVGSGRRCLGPRRVTVQGTHVDASITWSGLPHLLVWEELAASLEAPWNGRVVASASSPPPRHGAGTGIDHGIVTLGPGERLDWRLRSPCAG